MDNKSNQNNVGKKIFITAALPYCNNFVHAGNLIGSTLSADIFARYQRKKGNDVMFICGTDDYGSQTEHKALQENLTNKELCDKYRSHQMRVYEWFNLSFNVFGKTSTEIHTQITQEMLCGLQNNNLLKEKIIEQHFCQKCNRFLCDRFIHGVCYHSVCGGKTKGDECEKCCKILEIDKVLSKRCSICDCEPIKKMAKHLYFDLAPYKDRLIEYFSDLNELENTNTNTNISQKVKYMSTSAKRVTKEWLNKDLTERCVTRNLVWGVPLPNSLNDKLREIVSDDESKLNDLNDSLVCWPWLDAPFGYISILADKYPTKWREWINGSVDWVQFMAKDNVPFHSIVFPATLIGSNFANLNYGVTHLASTEYLLYNGEKFSKSAGIGIFGDQIIQLSEKINIDEDYWRYYLVKIRPEHNDSTFTFEGFCEVIKGELCQKMGNLVNRGVAMSKKYYQSNVIKYDLNNLELQSNLVKCLDTYFGAFEKFSYHEVLCTINRVAEIGNEWINEKILWNVCRENPSGSEHLMGNLLFVIWLFSEMIEPIMPKKAKTIKTYFIESNVQSNILSNINVTHDDIRNILTHGTGNIITNTENAEKLFNQIKLEDILVHNEL